MRPPSSSTSIAACATAHRAGVAVEDDDPGLGVLLEHPVAGRELADTAREPEGNSGAYMRAARLLRAVQR